MLPCTSTFWQLISKQFYVFLCYSTFIFDSLYLRACSTAATVAAPPAARGPLHLAIKRVTMTGPSSGEFWSGEGLAGVQRLAELRAQTKVSTAVQKGWAAGVIVLVFSRVLGNKAVVHPKSQELSDLIEPCRVSA